MSDSESLAAMRTTPACAEKGCQLAYVNQDGPLKQTSGGFEWVCTGCTGDFLGTPALIVPLHKVQRYCIACAGQVVVQDNTPPAVRFKRADLVDPSA